MSPLITRRKGSVAIGVRNRSARAAVSARPGAVRKSTPRNAVFEGGQAGSEIGINTVNVLEGFETAA